MLKLTAAAALLVATYASAFAQEFPAKTVRVIVGFPPGGAADIAARLISQKLGDLWGRQVIVDNRPGAGGNLGAEMVAKAAPDGYTLHLAFGPTAPSMYPKLPFDPQKDFAPITLMAQSPMVLVVHPSVPASNVKELIALARSHPGKLNYASTGVGITVHLAMELFRIMAKINIVHVPYKGASPAVVDLLGGQIELTILSTSSILGQIKTQRVRALAVTSLERSFMLPDVPTLNEAGVPGYETTIWWGLSAPAGTTRELVQRLNAAAVKSLGEPDIRKKFADEGAKVIGSTPAEFGEFVNQELAKWDYVVRTSGIRAQLDADGLVRLAAIHGGPSSR